MRHGQLNVLKLRIDIPHQAPIETLLLGLQLVRHKVTEGKFDPSRVIGMKLDRRLARLEDSHQGVRNHNAVLVKYGHCHRLPLKRGPCLSIQHRSGCQGEDHQNGDQPLKSQRGMQPLDHSFPREHIHWLLTLDAF